MFFQAVLVGFSLLIVGQLVRWQIVERRALLKGLQGRAGYVEEAPPQRGLILDRDQNLLAMNNYEYAIEAAPCMIPEEETTEVARKLAPALGRPYEEVFNNLKGDALYALIERRVPHEVGKAVLSLGLPGIFANPLAARIYPERELAAHTLGFVAEDAEQGTRGYYGVEGFYDKVLKGETSQGLAAGKMDTSWRVTDSLIGLTAPWNSWQEPISLRVTGSPVDRWAQSWTLPQEGRTLVLTIQRTIQYLVEQELRESVERYGAEGGCIVVMDPKTGALLASASYPSYDPNRFAETSAADEDRFVDPVIGRQYEPGSTFKVITMAAALDAGVIQPTDVYNDLGYIEVGGRILKNWDERNYGLVTMTDILVRSLNTGAAYISTLLGPDTFYNYVSRFGFEHKTGIDLEGEVSGTVRRQGDPEWHESDLGTNAFGQGLAVTPLQMVVAVGAVANRGFLVRPYVVEEMISSAANDKASHGLAVAVAKQITVRQVVKEKTVRMMTEMMVEVVEQGATLAQVEGYRIAGKTGTAQTPIVGGYDPQLTIASFIGFAPADDPQFVVLVRLDKPTAAPWGSATAAPTFANVARILFTQLSIPPDHTSVADGTR